MTLGPLALLSLLLGPLCLGAGVLRLFGLRVRDDRLAYPAWCALAGGLGTGALLLVFLVHTLFGGRASARAVRLGGG